jgi:serine/threonine protein kinase
MQYVLSFIFSLSHAHVKLVHWWLREKVGILHRDLSLNNIMYRRINGKVYGVLTDFDLSSWTASLTGDYKSTSQQRTGTPPYMAYELLKGTENLHLYRHDVESLFYIMLILASHYEIHIPQDTEKEAGGVRMRRDPEVLPYERWFDQPLYEALADFKSSFLRDSRTKLDLTPSFEDFRDWIESIRWSFRLGVLAHDNHRVHLEAIERSRNGQSGASRVAPTFDSETLGGHVCYSMLIDSARGLRGKLEGLIVRYDTTPAGVDAADA